MPVTNKATFSSVVEVQGANGMGSTNTSIDRYSNIIKNQGADITYADSVANGASFTINTPGMYTISRVAVSSAAFIGGASVNSTQLTTSIDSITAANRLTECTGNNSSASCSWTCWLNAGDVVRPHSSGYTKVSAREKFSVARVG